MMEWALGHPGAAVIVALLSTVFFGSCAYIVLRLCCPVPALVSKPSPQIEDRESDRAYRDRIRERAITVSVRSVTETGEKLDRVGLSIGLPRGKAAPSATGVKATPPGRRGGYQPTPGDHPPVPTTGSGVRRRPF